MRLSITFFLSIIVAQSALGQDKFVSGFYLTNTNDSVRGFIQYKSKYANGIVFRSNLKSPSLEMKIDQVQAFGFTSGSTLYRVEIQEKNASAPIFVRLIGKGEVSLYGDHGSFLVGSEKQGNFRLAKKSANEADALKNYQRNSGAFSALFQDCPALLQQLPKIAPGELQLVEMLKNYHTCRGLTYQEIKSQKTKRLSQFGFFVGASISNLSFRKPNVDSNETLYLHNLDITPSVQPSFGVFALFPSRGPSSIFALQTELIYTRVDFKSTSVYEDNVGGYAIKQTNVVTMDYNRLSLRGGVRLTGRSNQLNPYFAAGLATQAYVSSNSNLHQTTVINDDTQVTDIKILTRPGSPGFWFNAGLKKKILGDKALFLDVNYEYGSISDNGRVTVLVSRIGFMF